MLLDEINEAVKDLKFMDETKCPWYNEGEIQIDPFEQYGPELCKFIWNKIN